MSKQVKALSVTFPVATFAMCKKATRASFLSDLKQICGEDVKADVDGNNRVTLFVASELAALRICFTYSKTQNIRYEYSENLSVWAVFVN